MEIATALIWTLRIVLPIVLFCIYFKLQSTKEEQFPGPTKNSHSRKKILARRQVVLQRGNEPPEELQTLALKDATQAPALFVTNTRSSRNNRREERQPRERRERKGAPRAEKPPEPAEGAETAAEPPNTTTEEKQHLESLLNYVAFNRKEQQRTFLPDEAGAPPPPPKRRPPTPAGSAASPTAGTDSPATKDGGAAVEEAARKANADAQQVLRGAISFKRADVAKDIYEQLMEQRVEIAERTFTLMIEASVLAGDLKSASDFLMKMETTGYCPDTEVLDKVMDLYEQQKQQREQERSLAQAKPTTPLLPPSPPTTAAAPAPTETGENAVEVPAPDASPTAASLASVPTAAPMDGTPVAAPLESSPMAAALMDGTPVAAPLAGSPMAAALMAPELPQLEEFFDGPRSKLSSDARIFVPTFGIPPPPPPPPMAAPEASMPEVLASPPLPPEPQRTKLAATAKPFEPQFNYSFDSFTYTWTPGETWMEEVPEEPEPKGGKHHGKGGADQKATAPRSRQKKPQPKGHASEKVGELEQEANYESNEGKDGAPEGRRAGRAWKPKVGPES